MKEKESVILTVKDLHPLIWVVLIAAILVNAIWASWTVLWVWQGIMVVSFLAYWKVEHPLFVALFCGSIAGSCATATALIW